MWNAISPGFELVSLCLIPATITITPRASRLCDRWTKTWFDELLGEKLTVNKLCWLGVYAILTWYICSKSDIDNSLSVNIANYIINIYHHHHVVPLARISLTLSRHFSLSFIAFGRSSGLHPVSSHSCWMYVRAGRPTFARPHVGVHWSISLMSLSFFSSSVLHVWFV